MPGRGKKQNKKKAPLGVLFSCLPAFRVGRGAEKWEKGGSGGSQVPQNASLASAAGRNDKRGKKTSNRDKFFYKKVYILAKRDFLPVKTHYILEMPKSLALSLVWIVCQKLHLFIKIRAVCGT